MTLAFIGTALNTFFILVALVAIVYWTRRLYLTPPYDPVLDWFSREYAKVIRELIDQHILDQAAALGFTPDMSKLDPLPGPTAEVYWSDDVTKFPRQGEGRETQG